MSTEPLIVTFADASYLPLLQIWLGRLTQLGLKHVCVFCLDRPTLSWCETQGVSAYAVSWDGSLRDLWVQRIRVFSRLLAAGHDIIHSDTDAIWVQDPLRVGSAAACNADLLFSQGTVWPPDVHDRWGFVLCCGWFRARPTLATRSFFHALETDVKGSGDDQISVNRLLVTLCATWNQSGAGDYALPFRDRLVQCWREPIRATAGTLSVALLPHREFQRLPEDFAQAVVKHYLTPKNCAQKLVALRTLGLIA
jgi:hypothetical protein